MDAETKQAFAEVMAELKSMNQHLSSVDNRLDAVDDRLNTIDNRLDAMDNRFDVIDNRLDRLEQGQEQLAQNTATILNAITVYSQVEQAHYEELSGKITQLSEKQEALEIVQNQHSIDIMQLRAAQ
ncbi:MAG: hypothetical protein IKU46_02915 [Peptococcaceae bacterium]|nr:hypothetical protein [Peptococcaceae bacterium]